MKSIAVYDMNWPLTFYICILMYQCGYSQSLHTRELFVKLKKISKILHWNARPSPSFERDNDKLCVLHNTGSLYSRNSYLQLVYLCSEKRGPHKSNKVQANSLPTFFPKMCKIYPEMELDHRNVHAHIFCLP